MSHRQDLRLIGRRLLTVGLVIGAALLAQPSFAQDQGAAPALPPETTPTEPPAPQYRPGGGPGLLIISRSVGPRDALKREVGVASVVRIAPEEGTFAFGTPIEAMSDDQAAQINSGMGSLPTIDSVVLPPLQLLAGNNPIGAEGNGGAGGGGAGGVGGLVGDAIGQGMGALSGALSGLSGFGQ